MVSMSRLGRRVAVLAATLVLAFFSVAQADGGLEGIPAGPPACSVVAKTAPSAPRAVDFWLQCNVRLRGFSVTGLNRRVRALTMQPVLFGATPTDTLACRIGGRRAARTGRIPWRVSGVLCDGSLAGLARVHLKFAVDREACLSHPMRLGLYLSAGEECSGNCPAPRYSFISYSDPRMLGCG